MPFPLKFPIRLLQSGPTSNTWFLGSTRVQNPNSVSSGSAILHSSLQCHRACPSPELAVPSHGAKWTASNTLFLRPIWVQIPNGISIGSAIVAQLTAQCRCSGMSFPLKIAHSLGSDLDPYLGLTHGSVHRSRIRILRIFFSFL